MTDGCRFMSRSSSGEVVVALPSDVNASLDVIVPRIRPWEVTVDLMLVTPRSAVKGFARATVTWEMLFVIPVVSNMVRAALSRSLD